MESPVRPVEPSIGHMLTSVHARSKLPHAVVAGMAGISESYLSKLLNGQRCRPSRDLLLALGLIWSIRAVSEMDEILEAAGHPRLSRPELK